MTHALLGWVLQVMVLGTSGASITALREPTHRECVEDLDGIVASPFVIMAKCQWLGEGDQPDEDMGGNDN